MHYAMIGTRGVPAHYGGFETAVEEVGQRLAARGHDVTVFCRPVPDATDEPEYLGMRRVTLPALRHRVLETLSHTALSVVHSCLADVDAAIVFNAANAPLLPVLRARRIPLATHVDGLEWRRAKWGWTGRHYYRTAEALAVRWSDALIADAQGIADYFRDQFDVPTRLIAYGAPVLTHPGSDRLADLGLQPRRYHLIVARFERENHVLEMVRGYVASRATAPLVVVGSTPYGDDYTQAVAAAADDRVRLVGGVWDSQLLDQLYANALCYLHGHSVGGTNPSLLRAGGAAAPVIAFDVSFNREVVDGNGRFFTSEADLAVQLEAVEADPTAALARGKALQRSITRYDWDDVATRYEELLTELAVRGPLPRAERLGHRRLRRPQLALP